MGVRKTSMAFSGPADLPVNGMADRKRRAPRQQRPGWALWLLLALVAADTPADELVTEGKYFACLSEQWLDEFTAFAVSGDRAGIEAYVADDKCLVLRPNLPVKVSDASASPGARTAFTIHGIRFFAPREEIVRK